MTTEIANYQRQVDNVKDTWLANVALPYADAYTIAFTRFHKTLDDQKNLEKMYADLAMVALSIAGGGVLAAVFAKTSLKAVGVGLAIETVCNRNMNKTFNAMAMVSGNKAASYMLGKAWDQGGKHFTGAFKKEMQTSMGSGNVRSSGIPAPTSMKSRMEEFLYDIKVGAFNAAEDLRLNDSVSDEEKDKQIALMRKAPFFSTPEKLKNRETLANNIELAFYMKMVLDTDYLATIVEDKHSVRESDFWGPMNERKLGKRESVDMLPSNPNYPKAAVLRSGAWSGSVGSKAGSFKGIGSRLEDRVNELYPSFFNHKWNTWKTNKSEYAHVVLAEKLLDSIGQENVMGMTLSN